MPSAKRLKLAEEQPASSHAESEADSDGSEGSPSDAVSDSGTNTDDEIAAAQVPQKSKKTLKRKHRATEPAKFGATLLSLLDTDAPSSAPLSLQPAVARKRNDDKLESKARRVVKFERKEREDKHRVTDVIGGWGGESERALRKVAQRGVVKLFNAIQQSQAQASQAAESLKAKRGSGKPTLPAPSFDKKSKGNGKDIPVGRGQESALDKDDFMDMIRSGGIVSKS
ncbi:hypothetical protein EVG20_g3593 [Dentipellis fragilis]|uniref:Rrp15p-domain-containing protein n=1 Tax=Dentipellis fragilis TaxID=205917 RepID=A0A4Y9Z3E1_9AGAM|nr:hypothetical protein EVG20_g3593 [Dentipellis fragilis]